MPHIGPVDVVVAFALAVRRFGFGRALLGAVVVAVGIQPLLPPVPCSCLGPVLRRCDHGWRRVGMMRSDLKNLLSEQEIHRSEHLAFSDDLAAVGFTASDGVTVTAFATADMYVAWTIHEDLGPSRGCAVYVGRSPPDLGLDAPEWTEDLEELGPGEITCR